MIVIIDDQQLEAASLAHAITNVMGVKTLHFKPDEGYNFVCANPWSIELVLIDEVFDPNIADFKFFNGGTALGEAIYKQFDFIPLVLYTANDLTFERSRDAMSLGFCDALNKNEIARESVIEMPGGEVNKVTASESLSNHFKKIKSTVPYKDLIKRRKEVRLEHINQVLTSLSDYDLEKLHNAVYRFDSPVKNFKITHDNEQLTLTDLLNGWIDPRKYTEDGFRQLIINESLLPSFFEFRNPDWQQQFMLYQQEGKSDRYMAIERKAINFLLEALEIDKKYSSVDDLDLSAENVINYSSFTFNKKVDHGLIFDDKMIARRIFIASALPGLFKNLEIINLVALIINGNTNTMVSDRKRRSNKQVNKSIDPSALINTQLELRYFNNKVINDVKRMTKDEILWLNFVNSGNISKLKILCEEYNSGGKNDLNDLKLYLEDSKDSDDSFNQAVSKVTTYCQSYCIEVMPIIDSIIRSIR